MYVKATRKCIWLLEQCLNMSHLKQVQSHLTVSGTLKDPYAAAKIISFCAVSRGGSGDLFHAYQLFLRLQFRSTFIWNTMIGAFASNESTTAISLYKQMLHSQFLPNNYTFSFLLKACTALSDLHLGFAFYAQAFKLGWESYDFVLNGFIHLYAACGSMEAARRLFDFNSSSRDVVTWTALIHGYVKAGQADVARQLFEKMPEKNVVSWSAIITGYVQVGLFKAALELFNSMQISGFRPNHASIVGALTACACLGSLDQGKWIHAYIKRNVMELDVVLGSALVDMYAKCGCIANARDVFDEMPNRDVYVFTCLISGLANHGRCADALELFTRMQNEGLAPNEITFICVLNACSRMGLVDEGLRIFESMNKIYNIEPQVQHYGCLVDLLGRAGRLEEAQNVLREMPMEPDSYVLGALLNACRVHGHVEMGKEMVDSLVKRNLDRDGAHVLLSNIYASAHQWDNMANVRKGMNEKNVRKVPGCSLIEVDGTISERIAGDISHA